MPLQHVHTLRVRYSEVDAMGTYYNSRAFEWFECGRTELCRSLGKPYTQWELDGVGLPLVSAHADYLGKAQYDDLLRISTTASMAGRARLRFDMEITHAETGQPICRGYTIHAVTDRVGRPIRPPRWLLELMDPPCSSESNDLSGSNSPSKSNRASESDGTSSGETSRD
jgi:acyl-CoA thioester hydrolase